MPRQKGSLIAGFSELRVHGVSGTPPRDMLYTDPVTRDPPEDLTRIYELPRTDSRFNTKAFHWGSLTSAGRITAFWILLAPFALANAAGWMAHRKSKLGRAAVRSAGLALTGLFVSQALTAGVMLPISRLGLSGPLTIGDMSLPMGDRIRRLVLVVLTGLVSFGFYLLVARASTRSHSMTLRREDRRRILWGLRPESMLPEGDQSFDDAGGAVVTDPVLWRLDSMVHRLRRLNLGAGFLVAAVTMAVLSGSIPVEMGVAAFAVTVTLAGALTTFASENRLTLWATTLAPHLALAAVIVAAGTAWVPDVQHWVPGELHKVTFGITTTLGVFVLFSIAAGPLSVGALVLATFIGAVLGSSVGLIVESALGVEVLLKNGVGWVAVAMLILIAWLALVAAALASIGRVAPDKGQTGPLPKHHRFLTVARRIELEARWLFYAAGAFGIGAFANAIVRVWNHGKYVLGASAEGGFWSTLSAGLDPVALGRPSVGWVAFSVAVTISVPGAFMLRSLLTGWNEGDEGGRRRRSVGILWDLGSFWPRWYQPLAPPSYGPQVIRDMRSEIDRAPAGMILGAHSQGSLIAAVAIQQRAPAKSNIGFITYGSQLGILYPRMFPAVGMDSLVAEVAGLVNGWINLWRSTDPIGGHFVAHEGVDNRLVITGAGHSGYEVTPEYGAARREMAGIDSSYGPDPLPI